MLDLNTDLDRLRENLPQHLLGDPHVELGVGSSDDCFKLQANVLRTRYDSLYNFDVISICFLYL